MSAAPQDIPNYGELGQREAALKKSQLTYKHALIQEARERGEIDTQVYGRVKEIKASINKNKVESRQFPTRAEDIKQPGHGLKLGNPLYTTSNMNYGEAKPAAQDMPDKYFPRPEAFTTTFLGGQFSDTGLNTTMAKSKVWKHTLWTTNQSPQISLLFPYTKGVHNKDDKQGGRGRVCP